MRMLPKAVLTATLAAAMSAAFVAPSQAVGPFTCPKGEDICVYVSGTYPVTNPLTFGPVSSAARYVQLPAVCDASGTDCITPYLGIPGASVNSTGGTIATVTIPGTGIGINSTTGAATLYVTSLPTYTVGSGAGITTSVTLQDFPVIVAWDGISYECASPSSSTIGPVTVAHVGCASVVTVSS